MLCASEADIELGQGLHTLSDTLEEVAYQLGTADAFTIGRSIHIKM